MKADVSDTENIDKSQLKSRNANFVYLCVCEREYVKEGDRDIGVGWQSGNQRWRTEETQERMSSKI